MKQFTEGVAGQLLAVAIGVCGLAILYLLVVSPVLQFFGDRADLVEQRVAMARRYQSLSRDLPALRAADKAWRDQSGGELLLDGSSDAVASAALQGVMKSLVEDSGGKLSSSEVLQAAADGDFRRVGIRVVFSGDLKLVTAVMSEMEKSRPVLSVGDFSLHTDINTDGGEDTANGGGEVGSELLAVTLDVYGFRAG